MLELDLIHLKFSSPLEPIIGYVHNLFQDKVINFINGYGSKDSTENQAHFLPYFTKFFTYERKKVSTSLHNLLWMFILFMQVNTLHFLWEIPHVKKI